MKIWCNIWCSCILRNIPFVGSIALSFSETTDRSARQTFACINLFYLMCDLCSLLIVNKGHIMMLNLSYLIFFSFLFFTYFTKVTIKLT